MDFLSNYSDFIVLVFVLAVWCIVFFSLTGIDKKLGRLEKE